MELIFGGAMKRFETFKNIEKYVNRLYSFYKKSHKRNNSLRDFLKAQSKTPFSLSKIFDIRWVSSQLISMLKLTSNYEMLLKHLALITQSKGFNEKSKNEAKALIKFLMNKHVLSHIYFNMDLQELFKKESKFFQNRHGSILGNSHRRSDLKTNIEALKIRNGQHLKKFLRIVSTLD